MTNINIDTVAAEFNKWRCDKGGNRLIPPALWQQVAEILPHYRQHLICKRLNISAKQLSAHGLIASTKRRQRSPKFLTTSMTAAMSAIKPGSPTTATQPTTQICLRRADGAELIFSNFNDAHVPANLIRLFLVG